MKNKNDCPLSSAKDLLQKVKELEQATKLKAQEDPRLLLPPKLVKIAEEIESVPGRKHKAHSEGLERLRARNL